VVDLLLPFLHTPDVVREGDRLGIALRMRAGEAQQRQQALPVAEVLPDAFLEDLAELGPETLVRLGPVRGELVEHGQHAPDVAFPDRLDVPRLLEDLPRDVE